MADIRFLTMPRFRAFDDNGDPLGGGKVYVYAAGTSTKISTWQDALKGSKNTNPVILDSEGYADIFFDQNAKIVLDDANDVQQWSLDNISPLNAQTVTGRFNLIPNGSFELDGDGDGNPDDWMITLFNSSTSTVELDDTEVVDGVQSLKFVSQGDGGGSATSETFGVPNGGNISLSFWIKSSVAGVRNLVEIEYLDKDSQAVSTATAYDEDTSNPTTLTQQVFTDTVPGTATQARVKLTGCDQSDSTSGTTWFDFVQLTTQSYIFTGTPGEVTASASDLNKLDGATFDSARVELGGDFAVGEEVVCERIGNIVVITAAGALFHDSGTGASSSTGVIPSQFRPTLAITNAYIASDATSAIHVVEVLNTGTLNTRYFDGDFNGVSLTASADFSITYSITSEIT